MNKTDQAPETKTLVERLRELPLKKRIEGLESHIKAQAQRIQELEALAETDYLHQAMEAKKRIVELEGELAKCRGNNLAGNPYEWSHQALIDGLGGQLAAERSENAALKQEVATLKQDKNRIDWLEKGHAIVSLASGETRSKTMFCANFHEQNWREYETVREAIDAEIQVENNT